jgi:hypothetical protein
MRHRRFVPAFDSLSLRIAPSALASAVPTDSSDVPASSAAPVPVSDDTTSDASTAAVCTSLSDSSWSPFTCAVPTTALDPYLTYAD